MEVDVKQKTAAPVVDEKELRRRIIRRSDYVSCNQAFIDGCTLGSDTKENDSIIGPGVARGAQQAMNLREPQGLNIGAAAMPDGGVNNFHLHSTAEVLLNWSGTWQMRWGVDGADGELICDEGDIVSVPTWLFRGFTNLGGSHGWLFTARGFDNTGDMTWGPLVLKEAGNHGLFRTLDNQLIETVAGDTVPEDVEVISSLPQAESDRLRIWTVEQMQQRVVRHRDLNWSSQPFRCHELPGGGAELAMVIGYGMTEDWDQVPPVHSPHDFNLAWLRAVKDEGMLQHRHGHSQVLVGYRGTWLVTLNEGDYKVATVLYPYDTISVPAGAWRTFTALDDQAQMVVVNSGHGRVRIEWPPETVRHAEDKGYSQ